VRITEIDKHVMYAGWRNWVFVCVSTDNGLQGVGEATLEGRELAVLGAIDDLSRYLLGRDPFDIERHWHQMYHDGFWSHGPVLLTAISALEVAMWDIIGQALGQPIYNLLGGRVRDAAPVYANGWYFGAHSPEEFAERACETVERGFVALKWDPFGHASVHLSREEEELALERVAAVRRAVGPRVRLMVEAHGRFSVSEAIRIARLLAPFDCYWYEEPVPPANLEALAEVTRHSPIPTAAGERAYTRYEYAGLLARQAVRVIQPDVIHAGGMLEARKIAAMADAWHVPVAPHNPNGPVAAAATLHLIAGLRNFLVLEMLVNDPPWRELVLEPALEVRDGYLRLPDGPGLGARLNLEEVKRHPYQPRDLHFLSEGSVLDSPIHREGG